MAMYFDQFGKVRACCQNTGTLLGDVRHQTLHEIWTSASADALRSALEQDDYSEGCDFCAWQHSEGNDEILFARQYDGQRPDERRPTWPTRMEFAVTNTCNLQCAMCNGDWSSSIRAQREHRPPLPQVYGASFFEQLEEFLPHLRSVQFAGGEPFLGQEPLRIMEMLAALDAPPKVNIITNGTHFTPRVERILDALHPTIIMSIDGATPATYDAIRVGAHLPDVLANLDRFIDRLGADQVSITTCLMIDNWHEFADTLGLAEARGIDVGVNVVRYPTERSLYQLAAPELRRVCDALDATPTTLTGTRLAAWNGHRHALSHRADLLELLARQEPMRVPGSEDYVPAATSRWTWLPFPFEATASEGTEIPASPQPAMELRADRTGTFEVLAADDDAPLPLSVGDRLDLGELYAHLQAAFPDDAGWVLDDRRRPRDDDRVWLWLGTAGAEPDAEMIITSERDDNGHLVGARYVIRRTNPDREGTWPPINVLFPRPL